MGQTNYNGARQKPIGSGFNAKSTSTEVIKDIDLNGKIAIVTGGNTGIGLETVKTLANAGATVIVPARDIEKAKRNLQGIDNVVIEEMDLVNLIKKTRSQHLTIGKDVGIISYNETPLKEVLLDGITVISTDHEKMGESAARLILNNSQESIKNPFVFIRRKSL